VHVAMVALTGQRQAARLTPALRHGGEGPGDRQRDQAAHPLSPLSVEGINADLTSQADLTKVKRLAENAGIGFQGPVVVGPFDLSPVQARQMLGSPNRMRDQTAM